MPRSFIASHLDLELKQLHSKKPQAQLLPTSTISAPQEPSTGKSHRPATYTADQGSFQRCGWHNAVSESSILLELPPFLKATLPTCFCWATSYLSVPPPAFSIRGHISIWQPLARPLWQQRCTGRRPTLNWYTWTYSGATSWLVRMTVLQPQPYPLTPPHRIRASRFTPGFTEDVAY